MTPLFRFFDRHLPTWMTYPALSLSYFAMLAAILLFAEPPGEAIIYIDFRS